MLSYYVCLGDDYDYGRDDDDDDHHDDDDEYGENGEYGEYGEYDVWHLAYGKWQMASNILGKFMQNGKNRWAKGPLPLVAQVGSPFSHAQLATGIHLFPDA